MKRFSIIASVAAWFVASAGAQEPIAIGVSIAQSPPGSVVQGVQVKDGVEIMKDMINAKGGVLGRPIKLIYEDNQGVPEKGRAAAEAASGRRRRSRPERCRTAGRTRPATRARSDRPGRRSPRRRPCRRGTWGPWRREDCVATMSCTC